MVLTERTPEMDFWESMRENIRENLSQSQRELEEINLLLGQSEIEIGKLAKKSGSISAQMNLIKDQFDTIPREDIRSIYDEALDTQQRLFVMRGQMEKLQSDKNHIEKNTTVLKQVYSALQNGAPHMPQGENLAATNETLEMMIQAQEAERQRLSRQMHDGPAQALSNFILQTEIAMRVFDLDQDRARTELKDLKASATATFQKIRDFIFDLRPMMLDDLGLIPTVKRYIDAFKEKSGIEVRLSITGSERRLEPYLEVMIFRAIQELLANGAYFSQANQIQLKIDIMEENIAIEVQDNGKGFDVDELEQKKGEGLKVIKDRVTMLGGNFQIESDLDQGTCVSFQVPAGSL
jgi:two-component system sensor histidine kinase DegS